jgi:hypothetical protein
MTLQEHVDRFAKHPESKRADAEGNPAAEDTGGSLGRLHLRPPTHLGKEIDRLDEAEDSRLEDDAPLVYDTSGLPRSVLEIVAPVPGAAKEVGLSDRRFRDIVKGLRRRLRRTTREAIIRLAREELCRKRTAESA